MATDGSEHGPLSREQVKQWISEKRADKKTPIFPDGAPDWMFLESVPEFSAIFNPPPLPIVTPPPVPDGNNALNVIIPYKNVRALLAYYFGVFSVIPLFGFPLGIAGFVLGILGLRFRRNHPAAGGVVHAWIGIIFGGLFGLLWLALTILAIIGITHARNHR